ncbi:stage II sporulation protein M [Paenibacillus planticolens]|uniref:Stage II sporulation protein M n=1 Tax=Paenibacillus planticolens TaxID=2654976 RepID=A0ABX1ZNA7_9BACL|nr:stage II sporulation protein M [Paenibacillus planticolens]NOV00367.1 hypothetical protein [Paenibacillus planticolens]
MLLCIGVVTGALFILATSGAAVIESKNILVNQESGSQAAIHIFIRNSCVALILVLGLFFFALPTIAILFINGLWIGAVIASKLIDGASLFEIGIKILPHGMFEIPALLLAGAIGLKGIYFYYNSDKQWAIHLKYLIYVICFLFVGALVEGFITAKL